MSSPPPTDWVSPSVASRRRRTSAPSLSTYPRRPVSTSPPRRARGAAAVYASGYDAADGGSDGEDADRAAQAAREAHWQEMRQSIRYSALRTAEANKRGYYFGMSNKAPLVDADGRPLRPPRAFPSAHLRPWRSPVRSVGGRGRRRGEPPADGADDDDEEGSTGDGSNGGSGSGGGDGGGGVQRLVLRWGGASASGSSSSSGGSLEGLHFFPRSCLRCPIDDSDVGVDGGCGGACGGPGGRCVATPGGVGGRGGDGAGVDGGGGGARARSAPLAVPNGGAGVVRGRRTERLPPRKSTLRTREAAAAAAAAVRAAVAATVAEADVITPAGGDDAATALDGGCCHGGGEPDGPDAPVDGLADEWISWHLRDAADEGAGSDGGGAVGDTRGDGGGVVDDTRGDGDGNDGDSEGGGGDSDDGAGGPARLAVVTDGTPPRAATGSS